MIGKPQAIKGERFEYLGPIDECKDCQLFNVCHLNLEPNRVYEVVKVRNKLHPCAVHADEVQVIEVEEPPREVLIDSRKAMEGVTISYKRDPCNSINCVHYQKCQPTGIKDSDRLRILKVITPKAIECEKSRRLKEVIAHRVQ